MKVRKTHVNQQNMHVEQTNIIDKRDIQIKTKDMQTLLCNNNKDNKHMSPAAT